MVVIKAIACTLQRHYTADESDKRSLIEILRSLDPNVPTPFALEGGDMEGPIYKCIVSADTFYLILRYSQRNTTIRIYSTIQKEMELVPTDYIQSMYVHYQFMKDRVTLSGLPPSNTW